MPEQIKRPNPQRKIIIIIIIIINSQSALLVSVDVFAHHQKH